jgi:hypothetical protein
MDRCLKIAFEARAKVAKIRGHPARFTAFAVAVFPKDTSRELLVATVRGTKEFVHYLADLFAIRQFSNRNSHGDPLMFSL